jgi:iron complex outermembrane receptor protein
MQEDGYITNIATGNEFIDLDKTAFRISGVYDNGENVDVMLMAEYEDRDQSGTVYRANGNGGSYALLESIYGDLDLAQGSREVSIDEPPNGIFDVGEIMSLSMEINVETSIGKFTSLTGFKDHDYAYTEDFDATILRIFDYEQAQEGTYFEQEFRLVSDSDGPLNWYAGVSLYDEDIDSQFLGRQDEDIYCNVYWGDSCQGVFDYYNTAYGGAYAYVLDYYFGTYTWTPSPTGNMEDWNETKGKFKGWATYVDLNYQFTDVIDASFGIRYNSDEKDFSQEVLIGLNPSPVLGPRVQTGYYTPDGPITDKVDWNDTTYRLAVNFRLNDDNLVYASATTGYKQGGFNSFSTTPIAFWGVTQATPATHAPAHFNEETSVSYEVGYKGTLADNRVQVTANAFVYEFDDLQAVCGTTTPVTVVCNVGQLDGVGFEGTFNAALSERWQLMSGIAYFDSEATGIQDFCSGGERVFGTADACEGQSIPGAPEWTAFASLNADYPVGNGTLFGRLAWSFEGERRSGWLPLTPESTTFPEGALMVDGFSLGQLTIGYEAQNNWTAALYVENLTDEVYFDGGNTGGNPADPYVQYDWGPGRPRTSGLRLTYAFD